MEHCSLKAENNNKGGGFFLLRPHQKSVGLHFTLCISFLWHRQLETPRGHGTENQHSALWMMLEHNALFQQGGLRTQFTKLSIILFLKWSFLQLNQE